MYVWMQAYIRYAYILEHFFLSLLSTFSGFMKEINYDRERNSQAPVRRSSKLPLQWTKMPLYQASTDSLATGAAQSNGAEKLVW